VRRPREDKNVDFYDDEESELSVVEEYMEDEPLLKRIKRRRQRTDDDSEIEEDEQEELSGYLIILRVSVEPETIAKRYDVKALSK